MFVQFSKKSNFVAICATGKTVGCLAKRDDEVPWGSFAAISEAPLSMVLCRGTDAQPGAQVCGALVVILKESSAGQSLVACMGDERAHVVSCEGVEEDTIIS